MVETWTGSYSKLVLFEKCERAYYYKYIEGIEYTTPALEFGRKVHESIAKFITTGELDETVAEFITERVRQFKGTPQEFVERPIKFLVDGIPMDGFVDIVVNGQIIDWKTNWNRNADEKQLLLYAYGLNQEGFEINSAAFHYLRYGEDVPVELSEKNIQQTLDWTKQVLENIKDAELDFELSEDINTFKKAESTATCLTCPFKTICNGINTVDEAKRLAKEIEELESVLELKKELLRNFVEEYGEITTDTSVWKLTIVNNWDFDTKKVFDFIQSLGKDPLQYLNCTLTNLKKLKLTEQDLEKLGTKKITYRLTKTKAKEASNQ
ncbi:RecB family exonuclease [Anaerocellum danielii]|uniref:PD-(D/E)XK nuclease family protein n=1 Tax=Anaerocellum danielii TaxID=1387557 RepID=A0ABZ0TXF6_9FIRM|nr:PD-(D/E)XK nuclease family protein [Caldicellulosiruptor danielii]WPX08123.1 PD-(D/E)XK nuclease family protein [Caldicellulosiruptor danielii]